jgi:hypothetical protein
MQEEKLGEKGIWEKGRGNKFIKFDFLLIILWGEERCIQGFSGET